MPKWIKELLEVYSDGGEWEDSLPILERINALLRRSAFDTDDDRLHEEIVKEIKNELD